MTSETGDRHTTRNARPTGKTVSVAREGNNHETIPYSFLKPAKQNHVHRITKLTNDRRYVVEGLLQTGGGSK